MSIQQFTSRSPEETFELAEKLGEKLGGGEIILLSGKLGAGKTLFAKGVLSALGYDEDEVTSPSFTLVNLYKTQDRNVYHVDFWRLDEDSDVGFAVGLDEILEDDGAIVIIEWSEKLKNRALPRKLFLVNIIGDGDDPRSIEIDERSYNSPGC